MEESCSVPMSSQHSTLNSAKRGPLMSGSLKSQPTFYGLTFMKSLVSHLKHSMEMYRLVVRGSCSTLANAKQVKIKWGLYGMTQPPTMGKWQMCRWTTLQMRNSCLTYLLTCMPKGECWGALREWHSSGWRPLNSSRRAPLSLSLGKNSLSLTLC